MSSSTTTVKIDSSTSFKLAPFLDKLWHCCQGTKIGPKLQYRTFSINMCLLKFPKNQIRTAKYSWWSFLPKNLIEQYTNLANVYFLIMMCLSLIRSISISNGIPSLLPSIVIILVFTATKDLLEDRKRAKQDHKENNRMVEVLDWNTMTFEKKKWSGIQVGDLIKVYKDDPLPCDMIVLHAKGQQGNCYVETKSLDGETNFKTKTPPGDVDKMITNNSFLFQSLQCLSVKCGIPDCFLYNFEGLIEINNNHTPVDYNNFVLRGSNLRRNEYILGLATYTGHETKIMMNSKISRSKVSQVQRTTSNRVLELFIVQIVLAVLLAGYSALWTYREAQYLPYIISPADGEEQSIVRNFFLSFGTWNLIVSQVPISIIINLEFVRIFQAIILQKEDLFKPEPTNEGPTVNNSKVLEDLGQVEHIFSDKTGTLTLNIMMFKALSIAGQMYGDCTEQCRALVKAENNVAFYDPDYFEMLENSEHRLQDEVKLMLILLATCHSVQIDEKGAYNATSPDELSLINFAKMSNFEFLGQDENNNKMIKIRQFDEIVSYEIMNMMEFTSARKKMSIIIKTPSGEYLMFSKGADNVIFDNLSDQDNDDSVKKKTSDHLLFFSEQGFRTLALSYKTINEETYTAWSEKLFEAEISLIDRDKMKEAVYSEIEKDMILLGATAVEDKLQPDVRETLEFIHKAGQKLWVLTGDKLETTINIATSCGIITKFTQSYILNTTDIKTIMNLLNRYYDEILTSRKHDTSTSKSMEYKKGAGTVLLITGAVLGALNKEKDILLKLIRLGSLCKSVLVCRTSPSEKADIVKLFREIEPHKITLAIGDGANDVSMIISAHVGVGIKGKEGYQAARASDFSINEFRNLKPLMYVHGRELYVKNSNLLNFIFYRNTIITTATVIFGFEDGFSGQSISQFYIGPFYQLFYTSLIITVYAIFDWEYQKMTLMRNPEHYVELQNNQYYDWKSFLSWQTSGVLQGAWVYLLAFHGISAAKNGRIASIMSITGTVYYFAVLIVNLKALLICHQMNMMNVLSVLFGMASLLGITYIASLLAPYELDAMLFRVWYFPSFYLGGILMVTCAVIVEMVKTRLRVLKPKKECSDTKIHEAASRTTKFETIEVKNIRE